MTILSNVSMVATDAYDTGSDARALDSSLLISQRRAKPKRQWDPVFPESMVRIGNEIALGSSGCQGVSNDLMFHHDVGLKPKGSKPRWECSWWLCINLSA